MPRQLKHRSRSEIISSILEVTNGNHVRRRDSVQEVFVVQHSQGVFVATISMRLEYIDLSITF